MFDWTINMLVPKAIRFAALAHQPQKRQDDTPYFVHLARVARLGEMYFADEHYGQYPLSEPTISWGKEEVIAALWLHDTPEDTQYTFEDIDREFGAAVEFLVRGLTNGPHDKSKTKREERKERDRNRLMNAHPDIKLMKLLDRLDNVSDMSGFNDDFKQLYARESMQLVEVLRNASTMVKDDYLTSGIGMCMPSVHSQILPSIPYSEQLARLIEQKVSKFL